VHSNVVVVVVAMKMVRKDLCAPPYGRLYC
jgi:hypothetical protein